MKQETKKLAHTYPNGDEVWHVYHRKGIEVRVKHASSPDDQPLPSTVNDQSDSDYRMYEEDYNLDEAEEW